MAEWQKLTWLAVLGAAGTLARYWLDGLVQAWFGAKFPWGVLAVNVLGCFLFGAVWTLAEERMAVSRETRFVILTGFTGAFTTFSTFSFQTGEFLRGSRWLLAFANVAAQLVLGLVFLFLGMAVGRLKG